jgi:predicted P-loop ATPase
MTSNNSAFSSDQDRNSLEIPEFLDRRRRVVAADPVPARGVARVSAVGAVVEFPRSPVAIRPDADAMQRHVVALFGAATEGQVELAWIDRDKKVGAGLFTLDRIEALVEQAIAWNKAGRNIYIGAVLKHPNTPPFGRTSDRDAFAAWAFWLDLDEPGSVERAEKVARRFPPTLRVTTGTTPHVRQHWWWRLDEPVTDMDQVRAQVAALASLLGGDRTVCNVGRIMRLAGSIAWPTKPGRVAQIVTVKTGGPAYSADMVAHHAAPAAATAPTPSRPALITGPIYTEEMIEQFVPLTTTAPTPRPSPIAPAPASTASGSLGVLPPRIEDGREAYMVATICACLREFIGTHGTAPTESELFALAWPQYDRRVDWQSRPGRGPDEFRQKVATTLRRFREGRIRGLRNEGEAVASHEARRRADRAHGPENGPHDLPAGDWRRDLVRAPNRRPYFNIANAITVLRHHDDVAGLLAYDDFADRRLVMRPVPGSRRVAGEYPRELDDDDLADLAAWFARNGFPLASKTTVADAVGVIVRESVIHPVRHWLDALAWDGFARLDRWLTDYLGAADTEFVRHAGACWLVSAVARVMRPGCKADGVLILEGQQGIGKSTALRVLAGDWFGDALPPMTSKDASSYLRGAWIIELSELSAMSRADVEAIKAFLSRSEERFRPAYGRYEITVPRQCVFAGTTNQSSYLQDATGNRRFWPVTVGNIDLKRLEADRDQLLAEAVAAFRGGRAWWLPPEVETIARVEQAERVAEDAWTAYIARYIAGKDAVAVSEVATQGIGLKIENVGRAEQNRISGVLRLAGFERAGKFTRGEFTGCARFARGGGRPEF